MKKILQEILPDKRPIEWIKGHLLLICFCIAAAAINVYNGHRHDVQIIELQRKERLLDDKRHYSLSRKAELLQKMRLTYIEQKVNEYELGLELPTQRPLTID